MTPAEIDRVFGRGRLRMTTGEHVEVFREEARDGEERRYTKRFLETANGDFRAWTEREWRILDRLGARGDAAVARVVRFFPADESGMARLQTRDAGPTVDEWAALVPLRRTSPVLPYVFGDCANWWALARQCLLALDPLHALGFVHLDLKADNVCVPWQPAQAGRPAAGQPLAPDFEGLALIDVAFSLLPEIELPGPLPLAREPGYEYQSPRLLHALDEGRRGNLAPTLELDWRCDLFSLAAMLWRYLPELDDAAGTGWSSQRHASATAFVRQLLDIHGNALTAERPHRELIGQAALRLTEPHLAAALQAGSSFDPERAWPHGAEAMPLTRVVSMPATPRAAVQRREPMFEAPTPVPARPISMPASTPTPAPASTSTSASTPKSAASTPDAPGVLPTSARMGAPVATAAEAPVTRPAPAPASSAGSVAAAIGGAVARPSGAPSGAVAAAVPPAATATPIAARAAQGIEPGAASATRSPPPASPAPSLARSPTPIAPSSARPPAPSPARNATPPPAQAPTTHRAPPPAAERPRAPTTPVPILAAAGAGALLVALAAWWGLDGRAMFDRMAERRAAAAAAAAAPGATVAAARPTPAAAPAEASSNATTISAAAPSSAAQATSAPTMAAARPPASSAPAALNEPPATSTPEANEPRAEAQPNVAGELEATAADWIQNRLPRISQAAERQLASAMGSAARSAELRRRSDVRAAVQAARSSAAVGPDVPVRAGEARTLNEAALVAYWRDNSVPDAVRLQTQAFGANPLDPEVVGNLAFLRLKEKPPQAEAARQLALHALMLKDARFPYGRIDDWTTLAIADALTGRDKDARNAWFVSMALASDLQRLCNAAVSAEAAYGERLRPSVQAMLQRARSSAAYGRCEAAQAATPPAAPATQRKPAHTQVKSKSTQRARRAIP